MNVNPEINTDDQYITSTLKAFKLVDMKNRYNELIETVIVKKLGYKEFLA